MSAALLLKPQPLLHGRMILAPKLQTPTQALTRPITIQFFGFPTQTLAKPVRNAPCAEATRRDRVALGTCRPRHHWVRRRPREAGSEAFLCRIAGCALAPSRPAHRHMTVDHDIFCKQILREPTSARLRPPPIERTCKSIAASGQRRRPARWHKFVGHVTTHPLPTFQTFSNHNAFSKLANVDQFRFDQPQLNSHGPPTQALA